MEFPRSNLYSGQTHYQDGRLYKYDNDVWIHTIDMIPFHHWCCNITGGTGLMDSGLYPRSGRSSGTIAPSTPIKKIQRSVDLTGGGYYLCETKAHTAYGASFCCWFFTSPGGGYGGGQFVGLFYMDDSTGEHSSFEVSMWLGTSRLINNVWDSENKSVALPYDLDDNKWHHLCCTNTRYTAKIYLDGQLLLDTTRTKSAQVHDDLHDICVGGARIEESTDIRSSYSYIEDVRYYNRALTTYEVSCIHNKSFGSYTQTSLGGSSHNFIPHTWIKMQEDKSNEQNIGGSDPKVFPSFENITANHQGKISKSWYFSGGTASQLSSNTFTLDGYNFSFSFWAKDMSENIGIYWMGSLGTDNNPDTSKWCIIEDTMGIALIYGDDSYHSYIWYISSQAWKDDWHHFTAVFSHNKIFSYYDGVYDSNMPGGGILYSGLTISNNFSIGSKGSTSGRYIGYMEDFRIYDYCLHPNEIKNIYNDGKGILY